MKAVSLLSGGKDSFLSTVIAMEQGISVESSITVIPEEFSMMYHYPNAGKAQLVASLLDLNWKSIFETDLELTLEEMKNSGISVIIAGATASDYQKTRIEAMCNQLEMMLFAPLWRVEPSRILNELILRGIRSIVVSVSAEGLTEEDLGKEIDIPYIKHLEAVSGKTGINIVGEGGEFETFVTEFSDADSTIQIGKSEKEWAGSYGYLKIIDASLVKKE